MPELPEVETVVRTLRPRLVGLTITDVALLRPDIVHSPKTNLPQLLTGQSVTAVTRRGKKILVHLAEPNILCIHLGMTGQLTFENPAVPTRPHTHLIVGLRNSHSTSTAQLRFRDPRRFGGVWYLTLEQANANLGPEPLTLTTPQLAHQLARTRRPIKAALLDQSLIAGLGNIYVDESLFAAHIHPLTRACQLSPEQIHRLNQSIKSVLRLAIRYRGSSISDYIDGNGRSGRFQDLHKVYDRADQPCPTCQAPIHRIVITGRSTHFCPHCQPR
ncbi:MAG TPA: bifunctional DNA-formamidopyrimidine glycosylase/DNA-(apurinic or apyrimidinic site) lyase [Tepidisphaeraceae bacterium]|nr:bifunctional DNA-formamidopyrimidine glycosylase/DNA-(apurinic or apyrimidinic site) lyase [Tepidisphaeraceae bacterium]